MQISSLPSIIFSPSADNISIVAEGDIVVNTTVSDGSGITLFDNSSSYSPNKQGYVNIAELSELVNAAILASIDTDTMLKAGARSASCTLRVAVKGGVTATTRALYMSRQFTVLQPIFATQMRHRSLIEGQPQPVNILTAGQSGLKLTVGAAYRLADNSGLSWREAVIQPDCSKDYFTFLADTSEIKQVTTAPDGSSLLYCVLTLLHNDKQADCIRFDIDRKTRPSMATHFVYLNLFGVPEVVTFSGKDVEEQELDSDFGYAGRDYIRLDPQLTESHKSHSGWRSAEERRAIYDLMSSPYVFVYADGGLRRITITDVDSSVSRPSNEPQSVSFTWRYADERLMRQPFIVPDTGKASVFAHPPFDKTFA